DGSSGAENAIPFAAMAHRIYGAPLHFVQVIDQQAAPAADLAHANELFADYGRGLAASWKLPLADCRFQVFAGAPAVTLLDLAKNAAMVVLASHGRGGFRAFFL